MTKEWRTIDGLQVDKDWLTADNQRLLKENDRLRAELLKAPDAGMIAFIAAFGLRLEAKYTRFCGIISRGAISDDEIAFEILGDTVSDWRTLKAQHIGAESETE